MEQEECDRCGGYVSEYAEVSTAGLSLQFQSRDPGQQGQCQTENAGEVRSLCRRGKGAWGLEGGGGGAGRDLVVISVNSSISSLA